MFYVYLLRSKAFPDQRYIGFTRDLRKRVAVCNAGGSVHTAKYRPWELIGNQCSTPPIDGGVAVAINRLANLLKPHPSRLV
jgi:hypothetical protein